MTGGKESGVITLATFYASSLLHKATSLPKVGRNGKLVSLCAFTVFSFLCVFPKPLGFVLEALAVGVSGVLPSEGVLPEMVDNLLAPNPVPA